LLNSASQLSSESDTHAQSSCRTALKDRKKRGAISETSEARMAEENDDANGGANSSVASPSVTRNTLSLSPVSSVPMLSCTSKHLDSILRLTLLRPPLLTSNLVLQHLLLLHHSNDIVPLLEVLLPVIKHLQLTLVERRIVRNGVFGLEGGFAETAVRVEESQYGGQGRGGGA
jgi:hypothetical protein